MNQTITLDTLAGLYLTGEDATKDFYTKGKGGICFLVRWRNLVTVQYTALVQETGVRVTFNPEGERLPFRGAEAMFEYISLHKHLPISTDFNESELNGEHGNLLFRAAHDLSHWLCDQEHAHGDGERCNFALDGETRAMHRQTKHLLELGTWLSRAERALVVQVAFSEVVLQAAVFYHQGSFADQKVVLVPIDLINRWMVQNGLDALL